MDQIIHDFTGIHPSLQMKLFYSLLTLFIIGLLGQLVKKIAYRIFDEVSTKYQWLKIMQYLQFTIVLVIFVKIWFGAFDSLGTYLGLVSAGFAIALKDLITNLAGWFFIVIRKPFTVGDRLEIGEVKGDVIDIRIFQFSVLEVGNWVDADQSTGRIIHVPNSYVFTKPQANYTAEFEYIWIEIPVLVTFDSNWKKAKKILTDIVNEEKYIFSKHIDLQIKEAAKKYMINNKNLTPIVYTSVKDNGVMLSIRLLSKVRENRKNINDIWETILSEFEKNNDINLAYPSLQIYQNQKNED